MVAARRRLSEAEKLRIIRDAYETIFWRPVALDGHVAVEFVHLCGAILRGEKCAWSPESAIAKRFGKAFTRRHPIWRYIVLE